MVVEGMEEGLLWFFISNTLALAACEEDAPNKWARPISWEACELLPKLSTRASQSDKHRLHPDLIFRRNESSPWAQSWLRINEAEV
jgi:hypothetical protein